MKNIRKKKGDQKGMWRILKTLINNKSVNKPKHLIFGDEEVEVILPHIASLFNKFFIDSVKDIHRSIETSNNTCDVNSLKYCPNVLKFKPVTIEIIKHLKNKKDAIDIQFVLDAWSHIGQILLETIKRDFFKLLEYSMVVAVEKILGASKPDDYRPINMSTFEKILETVVKEQLLVHIDTNNIHISEQSGYRKLHSCQTARGCRLEMRNR